MHLAVALPLRGLLHEDRGHCPRLFPVLDDVQTDEAGAGPDKFDTLYFRRGRLVKSLGPAHDRSAVLGECRAGLVRISAAVGVRFFGRLRNSIPIASAR